MDEPPLAHIKNGRVAGKIVLVRPGRLGDFLCAIPAFRAVRAGATGADITFIGLPFAAELVSRYPYFDRFEPFPGFSGIADHDFDARRTLVFLQRMQAENFDLAIQIHGSGVFSNPFTKLLGAKYTAGFRRPEDGNLGLDRTVVFPEEGHEVSRCLTLVSELGFPVTSERLEFPLLRQDFAELSELIPLDILLGGRPLIGLQPTAEEQTRRWMPDRFAKVGETLARRYNGIPVITGKAGDMDLAASVQASISVPVLNLAGRTSLGALAALVSRLSILITNDSGPAHIAYALGTRSVTIFGDADHRRWGPPNGSPNHLIADADVLCRPCPGEGCNSDFLCLRSVSVEEVLATADKVLDSSLASSPAWRSNR